MTKAERKAEQPNQGHTISRRKICAFKRLRWAYPGDTMPQGLKNMNFFSQQEATASILAMTGLRHNHHHHHHNTWTKVLNDTNLMMKHTMVGGRKQVVWQQRGYTQCALCTQTTPWFSTKNTDCRECEQSGMDENHTNAL